MLISKTMVSSGLKPSLEIANNGGDDFATLSGK